MLLNWLLLIVILASDSTTCSIINKHILCSLEEDRLENAASLLFPLISQDLNVLACTLLDLNIRMISVCLDNLSDLIRAPSQADSEFRQSSQGPTNDGVAALSLAIMLIKNLFVHLNYVFLADSDGISVWSLR